MRYDDDRIEHVQRELDDLRRRVERLERTEAGEPREREAPRPSASAPPFRVPQRSAPRPAAGPPIDLEALLGGRVLAWVGGSAIVLGIVFFLAMAIRNGWIDEPTRTILAFAGSTALLGFGVWLYERKGQTEAALAAVASAIAGLYATLVVATQIYELVAPELGLAMAGLVGVVATAIAVRWSSTIVAGIGIIGALLAPVLVDAGTSDRSLAFMAVALTSAVGVLLWQRWDWLAIGAFVVSAPQLVGWFADTYDDEIVLSLGVLLAFWALYAVAAIGYELRVSSRARLPVSSWILLFLNVLLVAGAGYAALRETGRDNAAVAWVLGVALVHVLLGVFALRQAINREIGSLLIAVGLGLSAVAFADALDGPALVAGWAVQAVILAWLARTASREEARLGSNSDRLALASAGYLVLAFVHVLLFEAPLSALRGGVVDLSEALVAIVVTAAAALAAARMLGGDLRRVLEPAGAAAIVYGVSVAIVDLVGVTGDGSVRQAGQVWLSAFWTVTGLAAIVYGLFRDERRFRLAGLTLLGIAVAKVFLYDLAALEEIYRVLSFIALGLLLLAGAFAYQRIRVTVTEGEEG